MRRLLCVVLVGLALGALVLVAAPHAQLLNAGHLSVAVRQGEAVFDNAGSPWPFFTIEPAINYDTGGNGVAYSATPNVNCTTNGSSYRNDYINFNTDTVYPFRIGCFVTSSLFKYTINITQSGPYVVNLAMANGGSNAATVSISIDNIVVATANIPPTGGYDIFTTVASGQFNTTLGNHIMSITCSSGNNDTVCGDFRSIQGNPSSGPVPPCDIFGTAGTPCVGAWSSTRALYASYNGALYQVQRSSDNATQNIGLLSLGGYANAATQDSFCSGSTCLITKIYDQSPQHNDLTPESGRNPAIANALPITINGHAAYGVVTTTSNGNGYTNRGATGTATGSQAEGLYMVSSALGTNNQCCYSFGNAQRTALDAGAGTMTAIYVGSIDWWTVLPAGPGPWVTADMEEGLYFSDQCSPRNFSEPSLTFQYLTAMVKTNGTTTWARKSANAQSGTLTTNFAGALPTSASCNPSHNLQPLNVAGGIVMGEGGDASGSGSGRFFEGAITIGQPSDATDNTVQANIVSVGYGTSAPDVPAPAQAAGFTTLALNSDFTDSAHANLNQWLDCAGAPNPEWFLGWLGFSIGPGCGAFSMAADSATGTPQALRMQWINSYLGSNPNFTVMETVNLPVTQGRMFTNHYIEVVARYESLINNLSADFWNTGTFGPTALDDGGTVEWDGFESVALGQFGAGIHNWNGPNNGCGHWCVAFGTGVSPDTNYHRFAWRATGQLGSGYTLNSYYENVPFSSGLNKVATVNMGPATTNGVNNANPHLSGGGITTAPQILFGPDQGSTLSQTAVLWIKSIKIYVCPAWTANQTGPGKTIGGAQQCFTSSQDP